MYTFRYKILALVSVLFSSIVFAQKPVNYAPAISQEDINKAWFKPELLANKEPEICTALLEKSRKEFFSNIRDVNFKFDELPEVFTENWQWYDEEKEININKNKFYLAASCSGPERTEGCTISISDTKSTTTNDSQEKSDTHKLYSSWGFILAKKQDQYWIFTAKSLELHSIYSRWREYSDETIIEAFSPKEDSTWEKSCGITFTPTKKLLEKTKGIDEAFSSLEKMYSTASQVTGGSGGVRHGIYTYMFLDKTLYRPWAISGSFVNPGTIHPAIIEWGYLGVNEFEKVKAYKLQLADTSKVIAEFYANNFGWSKEKSFNMAHSAILGALNVDNKFGGYTGLFSEQEIALRKAILEHKSIDEIKAIPVNIKTTSAHVAVMYPAALSYLLEKGVDVNAQNDFGKTALMYAVQYNQIDSVKILLAKGANPNLFTTMDGYGLKRAGMTALHYAVRYASADIIKALLNAGAFPFSRTSEAENFYPIDWLHIYTSEAAKESNLNISREQLPEIESLLKLLSAEEQTKKVLEYILQGEKEYQQNHNKLKAYDKFKFALALDPKNERALNDFALLSITMEKWGEALESSQYIIDNTKNNVAKANAYYNYGLACEKNINQYGSTWTQYNGKSYCAQGLLDPFIKSYELKPMRIKAEKILSIFKDRKIKACNAPTNESPTFQLSFVCEEKSALCVLSKKDKLIDVGTTFNVSYCPSCGPDAKVIERGDYFRMHPSLKNIYELGDYHLATYSGTNLSSGNFFIDGKVCDDKTGIRNPEHSHLDSERLAISKDENERLPHEKIVTNPAALHTLFYITQIYNRLQIKNVQGNIYAQFPDNTYVKVIAGDRLATNAKLYIPKGASFSYSEGDLEQDPQNDRVLKVMDGDEFMKNEGKVLKVRQYGLVDLNKLAH